MVAALDPPVRGNLFGLSHDVLTVLLVARHEGEGMSPIKEFPCFVFVTSPRMDTDDIPETITKDDVKILAWGELYRTADDADHHRFE